MRFAKTISSACLAAFVGLVAFADESGEPAQNRDAVLDTIAQINHINWVVNVIKSYNNVIVLEEEYEKISPGNLYLDRIPDEETLNRITKMLDTLYSLRKDDRQMKKWRIDFRESRDRKIRDHKHKATKEAVDTITGQVKECCSLWDWATNPLGSLANIAGTVFNAAHYSVGLYNDYDNFVYELDKTAKDREFDFNTEKMDLLHNQNKELLRDQWKFIKDYNLDDRLRVTEKDIEMLLNGLKNDNPAWIFTRLYPMRERFSLFPEYWYYLSCAAMETGHFKEGLEACDTFFKVNRGLFRDDPMVGTVAFNKAFMLPKTKENKPEVRRCLELAWTKNANVTHPDWQLDYLAAIMYKGVFDEKEKAEMMLEHAIALIEQESRERTRYGSKAGVTLDEGLRNCRNALHQLRGEPLEEEPKENVPVEQASNKMPKDESVCDNEMMASLVKSQMRSALTDLSLYNDGVLVQIPNDMHLHDFSKFRLKMERNGTTTFEVRADDRPGQSEVVKDGSRIVLIFRTSSMPLRMDTFRLVYSDPICPLEWVVHSAMHYVSNAQFAELARQSVNNFYDDNGVFGGWCKLSLGVTDLVGMGESALKNQQEDKIKDYYSKDCKFYNFVIKGKSNKYQYKCKDGELETLDSQIVRSEWIGALDEVAIHSCK